MASSIALVEDVEEIDFDAPSRIAILRRAVAEVVVSAGAERELRTALGELTRLSALAEGIVSEMTLDHERQLWKGSCRAALVAVRSTRRSLDQLKNLEPSRARIGAIRSKLHAALATLSEVVASSERPGANLPAEKSELERALEMRRAVSDFYGAIPRHTTQSSSRAWAISVARAELKILLKGTTFPLELRGPRDELLALAERLDLWQAEEADSESTSRIHAEVLGVARILNALSARPEVKRHDARSLLELTALLSRRNLDDCTAERVIDVLVGVRGMDTTLDRLIQALPLDPSGALALILRRVIELRTRSAAS